MRHRSLILIALCVLSVSTVEAKPRTSRVSRRSQLLEELKKCVSPRPQNQCDEMSVDEVAELYKQGDKNVMTNLMDVAPHSDGALSESLGVFFGELICEKPRTFLAAVARRPRSERENLLFLASAGDGSGMPCRHLPVLRRRLKNISTNRSDKLSSLARECLVQVNKNNKTN
ncbi:MAG: hypothetical protein QOE33_937 [Acidobacteriota bacterium]|nr:hypothetical protein [Acidobacteriota bacterium]